MTQRLTSGRTIAACALLSFAFTISVAAQSTRWKEYSSEKGKFSVLAPGVPTLRYQWGDAELGTLVVYVTKFEKDADVWQVAYSDLPAPPSDAMAVKKLLELRRDRNSADRGSAKTLTLNGYPALEFKTSFPDGEYVRVTRVILVRQRIYELWAITDARKAASEDVTKFFDSFKTAPLTDEELAAAAQDANADRKKAIPRKLMVSGGVLQDKAIKRVRPAYPLEARAAGVSGQVKVRVLISEEGIVIEAEVVEGNELLREASLAAARSWAFNRTELSGLAVKVEGTLTFNFTLQ
jgi:TonB family protein